MLDLRAHAPCSGCEPVHSNLGYTYCILISVTRGIALSSTEYAIIKLRRQYLVPAVSWVFVALEKTFTTQHSRNRVCSCACTRPFSSPGARLPTVSRLLVAAACNHLLVSQRSIQQSVEQCYYTIWTRPCLICAAWRGVFPICYIAMLRICSCLDQSP